MKEDIEERNNDTTNEESNDIFLAGNKDENSSKEENQENGNIPNINYNNLILYEPKTTKIELLKEDKKKSHLHFKIIVIGNSGVGKSCLSLRATHGVFKEDFISTIGFEFYSFNVKINDKIVKLQIWDTCGQEIYRSLISGFYRSTELAIIVFSVADRKSFEGIENWLKEVKTHGTPDCKVFLIGNKVDLPNREVSSEEAINCKKEHGLECYMETSAKTGLNTMELFVNVALTLYSKYLKNADNDELDEYGETGETGETDNYFNLKGGIKEEDNDCQC